LLRQNKEKLYNENTTNLWYHWYVFRFSGSYFYKFSAMNYLDFDWVKFEL